MGKVVVTAMIENRPVVQESQTAGIRQSLFRYRPTDRESSCQNE